ncbi:Flavin-containing monooxygenase FMO GS-OX5, partial [Asimina triloba]
MEPPCAAGARGALGACPSPSCLVGLASTHARALLPSSSRAFASAVGTAAGIEIHVLHLATRKIGEDRLFQLLPNLPSPISCRVRCLHLMAAAASAVPPHVPSSKSSRAVAVIGAGAAGLVAARELRREGHKVVVYERGERVGGVWVYDAAVESDPLGMDPSRNIVHSSLYDSLRTNLPRQVMGFRDYPFVARDREGRDSRRYPGHREVLLYLEDFSRDFGLEEYIRFRTEVLEVGLVEGGRWRVRSRSVGTAGGGDGDASEVFDGVAVCNGHYTEPRIAEIPGVDVWPGKQIHSHNYRVPGPFRDQVVVVIGSEASAVDISRDISSVAREVHISSRSSTDGASTKCDGASKRLPGYDNMWLHSMVKEFSPGGWTLGSFLDSALRESMKALCGEIASAHEDGAVLFQDGSSLLADIILHCTGYKYHFPFLKTDAVVTVDNNRVGPLYKHVFPPSLAPWLSFIGLPWKVLPFPLCELQSKWVAGTLSGRLALPSKEEMLEDVKNLYAKLDAIGYPKRYTHNLSDYQEHQRSRYLIDNLDRIGML